jgi:hypothetical protein
VPFWSPTFSVTEERFTDDPEELADADASAAELLDDDEEHPAAARPARARTETAIIVR